MQSNPIVFWDKNLVDKTYADLEFKDVVTPGNDKCIAIQGFTNLKFERIAANNFAKAFIDVRKGSNVSIKDVYSNAMDNAQADFNKGIYFQEVVGGVIDGYISRGINYGGSMAYRNGDDILIESGCSGIRIRRFDLAGTDRAKSDSGIDSKVALLEVSNGKVARRHRGIRLWSGFTPIKDVLIEDCDEGIWLNDGATCSIERVGFTNCTRNVSDANGNPIKTDGTDPRVKLIAAGTPVLVAPTYKGPAVSQPVPAPSTVDLKPVLDAIADLKAASHADSLAILAAIKDVRGFFRL
jgi:hypothetical protein